MRTKVMASGAVLAFALTALVVIPTVQAFPLRGHVNANGGNRSSNGTHVLYSTAGQPAVGINSSTNFIMCHGFWCFGGVRVVDVEGPDLDDLLPATLEFGQPRPNPSVGQVALAVALPEEANVNLAIFDVQGRQVGTVHGGRLDAGYHTLRWDGRSGRLSAGVYFAVLVVDGQRIGERRVVMMR